MARAWAFGAILPALTGCHIIAGYDKLSLRDQAVCQWSVALGDKGGSEVRAVAVGSNGPIAAGIFSGAVTLGDHEVEARSAQDGFIAELGPDGSSQRLFSLGASGFARPLAASTSAVAGVFQGTLAAGSATLSQPSHPAIFLLDLDAMGAVGGARQFGGDGFALPGDKLGLVQGSGGSAVIGGGYQGQLDFGGNCSYQNDGPYGAIDLAKLAQDGSCGWYAKNGAGANGKPEAIDNLAIDGYQAEVVVGGETPDALAFGGNCAPLQPSSVDLFLAMFDPGTGKCQWSKIFGNAGLQSSARVAADLLGSVALAGYFTGALDFGGGPLQSSGNHGDHDIVVAKFTPAGEFAWNKQLVVGRSDPKCQGMSCDLDQLGLTFDASRHLIVAGAFRGSIAIDDVTLQTAGDSDFFIASFDEDGNLLWTGQFGDSSDQCQEPECRLSLAASAGGIAMGGYFQGAVDFGQGPLTSNGQRDAFVAQFLP